MISEQLIVSSWPFLLGQNYRTPLSAHGVNTKPMRYNVAFVCLGLRDTLNTSFINTNQKYALMKLGC